MRSLRGAVANPAAALATAPTASLASMSGYLNRRYLVSARDPAALAKVIEHMRADPALKLLDTIGPPKAPHTAVVSMNDKQAARLRLHFAAVAGLTVEADQPLSPLDGDL
jgi:hypothetical protein